MFKRRTRTEVQYVSSAAMWRSSESLKTPCLKSILESLAPMAAVGQGELRHAEECQ